MRPSSSSAADETVTIAIPRSALTIVERPRCVSQRTSERTLGLPRRAYLGLVRDFARAGGTVMSAGKLRLVNLDDFEAWLARRSRATAARPEPKGDEADELAKSLGLVAVGGRR